MEKEKSEGKRWSEGKEEGWRKEEEKIKKMRRATQGEKREEQTRRYGSFKEAEMSF